MQEEKKEAIFGKKLAYDTINEYIDARIDQSRVLNIIELTTRNSVNKMAKRRVYIYLLSYSLDRSWTKKKGVRKVISLTD